MRTNENKYDYIIGIDPDSDKSGVALLNVQTRTFEFVRALTFVDCIKFLDSLAARELQVLIVIEDSDVSTAFRSLYGKKPAVVFAMGRSVGKCHACFEHLLQYAESVGLTTYRQPPLQKIWGTHRDSKISQQELKYQNVSGIPTRTNPEMRDACLLALYRSPIPIVKHEHLLRSVKK
jgi:hypothetical protein